MSVALVTNRYGKHRTAIGRCDRTWKFPRARALHSTHIDCGKAARFVRAVELHEFRVRHDPIQNQVRDHRILQRLAPELRIELQRHYRHPEPSTQSKSQKKTALLRTFEAGLDDRDERSSFLNSNDVGPNPQACFDGRARLISTSRSATRTARLCRASFTA